MRTKSLSVHRPPRAGLRHRPTRPWPIGPIGPRGFRGPALSKVKEVCRHSYSLSHEKSEKKTFWIVTCFMYPRVFTKDGSCGDCSCLSCGPHNILGLGPLKALIRPCVRLSKSALEPSLCRCLYWNPFSSILSGLPPAD